MLLVAALLLHACTARNRVGLGSAYRECKASSKARPVNDTSLRCLSSLPSSTCIRQASATHLACAWDSTRGWGRLCRLCGHPWLPSARCAWRHVPCPSRHTRRRPATRGLSGMGGWSGWQLQAAKPRTVRQTQQHQLGSCHPTATARPPAAASCRACPRARRAAAGAAS